MNADAKIEKAEKLLQDRTSQVKLALHVHVPTFFITLRQKFAASNIVDVFP